VAAHFSRPSARGPLQIPKRNLTLVDDSKRAVQLTLWNQQAESFCEGNNPVIAVKSVRISAFNGARARVGRLAPAERRRGPGRSLSTSHSSVIHVNPDLDRAKELRVWWQQCGWSVLDRAVLATARPHLRMRC
jgi:hypothetical protein